MLRGLVAMARSGSHCPLRVSGGIQCSEREQSRDAFQAIPLEETSPRCNKVISRALEIVCRVLEQVSRALEIVSLALERVSRALAVITRELESVRQTLEIISRALKILVVS